LRLLAWPPTSLSMACMVAMLVVPIAILTVLMLVPLVHWQAAVVIVVACLWMVLLDRLYYREIRRYIMAGGSLSQYLLEDHHRRYGKNGELWTMARFRALPDDERREAAQLVVTPWWLYPGISAGVSAAVIAISEVLVMAVSGSFSWQRTIDAVFLALCAVAVFDYGVRYIRERNLDMRMKPPTRLCWALAIALYAVCCIPIATLGFVTGYMARNRALPMVELTGYSVAFVVLFSVIGWVYDRKQRDAIAAGV
ncbi:hypothetical protein JS533_013610, partial [Bifidobacterium amazonense]